MLHAYEIRPREDHRGVDLISDALPFGHLWYGEPSAVSNAVDYTIFCSRSCDAQISVYDAASNVIETHEHARDFKEGRRTAKTFLPIGRLPVIVLRLMTYW